MKNNKILFIVPSVIRYSTNPLSYSPIRSVFTPEERAEQTERTIASIRTKIPEAHILLIEMGNGNAPHHLRRAADLYLYLGGNKLIREAADGAYKGYGEAAGLLLAHRSIRFFQSDYYFKISGRYYLNENFQISFWDMNQFTAKKGNGWISTRLYGFPSSQYDLWRESLTRSIPNLLQGEAIENTMWRLLPDLHSIQCLGVSGIVAPWNEAVSD